MEAGRSTHNGKLLLRGPPFCLRVENLTLPPNRTVPAREATRQEKPQDKRSHRTTIRHPGRASSCPARSIPPGSSQQPSGGVPWPQFDLVIRDGTVIDGTGAAPINADIGIIGKRIAEVGKIAASGAEEIDARGKTGDAWLRRYPHALRRAGGVGQPPRAVLLAWRHHCGVRQLRRRLRPLQAGRPREAGRADGRRRGHSRRGDARGPAMGVGILPAIPRRARTPPARHRHVRAAAARRRARVRHGRARHQPGERQPGRHRRHARDYPPGHAGRCVRVLHVTQPQPQDLERRSHADAAGAGRRADRHRHGHARRRHRHAGNRVRMGAGPSRRIRHDPPRDRGERPAHGLHADAAPQAAGGLARPAAPRGPGGARRAVHPSGGGAARDRRIAWADGQPESVLRHADL